jgi:hypothetical protein
MTVPLINQGRRGRRTQQFAFLSGRPDLKRRAHLVLDIVPVNQQRGVEPTRVIHLQGLQNGCYLPFLLLSPLGANVEIVSRPNAPPAL